MLLCAPARPRTGLGAPGFGNHRRDAPGSAIWAVGRLWPHNRVMASILAAKSGRVQARISSSASPSCSSGPVVQVSRSRSLEGSDVNQGRSWRSWEAPIWCEVIGAKNASHGFRTRIVFCLPRRWGVLQLILCLTVLPSRCVLR